MSSSPTTDLWLDFFRQVNLLQMLCLRSPERSILLKEGVLLVEGLNQRFQSQILAQSGSQVVPDTLQRYLTEIHRQLRLLSTDFSLYQAARTEMLQQQRLRGICDRLESLASYGKAIRQVLQIPAETKAWPESLTL
jgi:DNA-binding GntR family transcriptional regulator